MSDAGLIAVSNEKVSDGRVVFDGYMKIAARNAHISVPCDVPHFGKRSVAS